jgi:hypothetical protein
VNPTKIPVLDEAKLLAFPEGYRHLGYAQSAVYKIKMDLPQSHGQEHDDFYRAFIDWLDGKDIEHLKKTLGV